MAVLIAHCHPQLPQHPLGGEPGHADQLTQAQGGYAAFVGRHPVDAPEPLDQRQFGLVEHRAGCYRSMVVASDAFII